MPKTFIISSGYFTWLRHNGDFTLYPTEALQFSSERDAQDFIDTRYPGQGLYVRELKI